MWWRCLIGDWLGFSTHTNHLKADIIWGDYTFNGINRTLFVVFFDVMLYWGVTINHSFSISSQGSNIFTHIEDLAHWIDRTFKHDYSMSNVFLDVMMLTFLSFPLILITWKKTSFEVTILSMVLHPICCLLWCNVAWVSYNQAFLLNIKLGSNIFVTHIEDLAHWMDRTLKHDYSMANVFLDVLMLTFLSFPLLRIASKKTSFEVTMLSMVLHYYPLSSLRWCCMGKLQSSRSF